MISYRYILFSGIKVNVLECHIEVRAAYYAVADGFGWHLAGAHGAPLVIFRAHPYLYNTNVSHTS